METQLPPLKWGAAPSPKTAGPNANCFKTRLDNFWSNQDNAYDFKAPFLGTGSRNILSGTVNRLLGDRLQNGLPYAIGPLTVLSCLSYLSVLSVTMVYCGQTVGLIKMKMPLGMEVGLGPGHIMI